MSTVRQGSRVRVVLAHHQLAFPPHLYGRDAIEGVVVSAPCDAGDMWYIRTDDGTMMALNPSSSQLVAIVGIDVAAPVADKGENNA